MQNIDKAFYRFLMESDVSMQPVFEFFIEQVRNRAKYTVEFPNSQTCLIKYTGQPVSLEIQNPHWDYFVSAPSEKPSKTYGIHLLRNSDSMLVSSTYLGYDIKFRVYCATPQDILKEVFRVGNLLYAEKAASITLIDEAEEPWSKNTITINPDITIHKKTYQNGLYFARTLASEFEDEMVKLSEQTHEKVENLAKYRESIRNASWKAYQTAHPTASAPRPGTKKEKPTLGKGKMIRRKKTKEKEYVPPTFDPQDFYEVEIVPSSDYLLLLKMTNNENEAKPVYYIGLQNSVFNMVSKLHQTSLGVHMSLLDEELKEVNLKEIRLARNTARVTSTSELMSLFQQIEETYVSQMESEH